MGTAHKVAQSTVYYDVNWVEHEHFISTSGTAFEMSLLRKFDTKLLLGQISYNQMAEIYNYSNGYPVHPKKCKTLEKGELPVQRLVYITTFISKTASIYFMIL